jgi:glycosidase
MRRGGYVVLGWLLAGCSIGDTAPPQRECSVVIWARASQVGSVPELVGSWDDWTTPGLELQAQEDGWYAVRVEPPPGEHGYLIVDGGVSRLDEHNPLTMFRPSDDREVSRLWIDDCSRPELRVDEVRSEGSRVFVAAQFLSVGAALDPGRIESELILDHAAPADGTIALSSGELARGRHTYEIAAHDEAGNVAATEISVFVDPVAPSWADAIVYQIMIDRFRADEGLALAPPPTPASRAGGTLGGVEAMLESGYFEALGVSALWLSPVYANPDEPREGTDGRLYEGYHGYWVLRDREVDERIGGEAALRSLIAAAHARGIAVILDVVPNHVYETHEIVAAHRDDGWFNEHPSECVCGTASCPWAGFMQDCWFAPYLPDLRLEHPDAMNYAVGELSWWLDNYEIDGLRIDAVPMMPRAASLRIAHEVRKQTSPGRDRLLLGEVFTGAGPAGVAGLRTYLGPDGLHSVFDFPTMWAIREVIAERSAGFTSLDALLDHIDAELAGSGAVLGRMLGNHDVVRFTTAVVGDGAGDPWLEPAAQPEGDTAEELAALERVSLALTLQLTLPGMPVLYQGDELALAGANDPDNRRVLPEPDSLSPARQAVLEHTRILGQLRRCSAALRSTQRETLHVGEDTYAYARIAEDGTAVVVLLSRADEPRTITLPGTTLLEGHVRDMLSGAMFELGAGTSIELEPRAGMVLLSEDDPCASESRAAKP